MFARDHLPTLQKSETLSWLLLLVAAAFEVLLALSMKASEGFTRVGWSIATVISVIGGIGFLTLALKELPVSVGYSVWTGLGIVGTIVIGVVVFNEGMTPTKALGLFGVVAGVVLLHFAAPEAS